MLRRVRAAWRALALDQAFAAALARAADPRLELALTLVLLGAFDASDARQIAARGSLSGAAIGGALFGAGWAITGACPAVGFVQIGEGKLLALFTVAGFAVGMRLYQSIHARYFRWDTGSCD